MALGASHKTHHARHAAAAALQKIESGKMSRAAKKGQCKVALTHFANLAFAAGAGFAESRGATPRHRRVTATKKQLSASRRVKGFKTALAKLSAACHK